VICGMCSVSTADLRATGGGAGFELTSVPSPLVVARRLPDLQLVGAADHFLGCETEPGHQFDASILGDEAP